MPDMNGMMLALIGFALYSIVITVALLFREIFRKSQSDGLTVAVSALGMQVATVTQQAETARSGSAERDLRITALTNELENTKRMLVKETEARLLSDARTLAAEDAAKKANDSIADLRRQLEMKKVITRSYKVMVIAPRTNLPLADVEVGNIINSGLNVVRSLLGPVTKEKLITAISESNCDLFYFVTHGEEKGLHMTDGLMPISTLTALMRGRAALVVLNSCSSHKAAQMIQNETEAAVLCTIIDIPDEGAFTTGTLFAQALARNGDAWGAYKQAQPGGNSDYLFLAGRSL